LTLKLIVGLGNPDPQYEYTRHNLGFLVVRRLAKEHHWKFSRSFKEAQSTTGKIGRQDVLLLLPLTYVNQSGLAVSLVVHKKDIPLEDILIVCDDLALGFGKMRLRPNGSDGGHKGLRSLKDELKTENFPRLRLGIGSPHKKEEAVDYVLGEFSEQEKKHLDDFILKAMDCCLSWLMEGVSRAMSRFNSSTAPLLRFAKQSGGGASKG